MSPRCTTYLEHDLGYATDLNYWPRAEHQPQWDWKHKPPGARFSGAQRAPTPRRPGAAMRENPHLKVFSLNGFYDMATPFFGTEYDLAHMRLDPSCAATCASPTTRPATWSI